jgi:PKD repeat protein
MTSGRLNPRDVSPLRPDRRQPRVPGGRWRRLAVALGLLSAAQLGLAAVPAVSAAAPTASLAISPNPANIGEPVNFSAAGSTPAPDTTIVAYEWDLGDGSYAPGGATASRSYGTPGQRTVKLKVTDSVGGVDFDAKTLTIANRSPVARIAATPGRAQIGQSVRFDGGESSDPDPGDAIEAYEWDLGGGFTPGGSSITTSYPAGGDKTVRLRVTDKFGGTGVATFVLHVNARPVAKLLFAALNLEPGQNPAVPLIGQEVGFASRSTDDEATNADKNNTITTYEWLDANPPSSGPAGRFGDNQPFALHAPYATAGDKLVVLRVTDNEGAVSELTAADAIARIRVNTRPVADFVVSPPTPVVGETVTFDQTADDPDPDDLTNPSNGVVTKYEWDLDGDGTFAEQGETGPRVQATYTGPGTKSVKLRVSDGGGARHEVTKSFGVASTRPAAGLSFSPQDPLSGQTVSFASTARATAGNAITAVEWDFDYDQRTFTPDAAGDPVNHAFPAHGLKTVAIRVTETGGGFDIATATVRVNAPPRASFAAAPGTPLTDDTVTLSSTSEDPDGPITQAWDTDDDGQFDDATGAVASRRFTAPGSYTVRLRVTDDRGVSSVAAGVVKVAPRPAQGVLSGRLTVIDAGVFVAGRTTRRGAKLTLVRVRAPVGTRVKLTCSGADCPFRSRRVKLRKPTLRLKALERRLDAGTRLIIEARLDGFIGRRIEYRIRKGKRPDRKDVCIQPGARRPSACPGS